MEMCNSNTPWCSSPPPIRSGTDTRALAVTKTRSGGRRRAPAVSDTRLWRAEACRRYQVHGSGEPSHACGIWYRTRLCSFKLCGGNLLRIHKGNLFIRSPFRKVLYFFRASGLVSVSVTAGAGARLSEFLSPPARSYPYRNGWGGACLLAPPRRGDAHM